MIDEYGYRSNVGIIISNCNRQVLWAKCAGRDNWQFPQGGIKDNETPIDAAYRELHEEIGLSPDDVKLVASTRTWLRYVVPHKYRRKNSQSVCIGQKQKWFLMALQSEEYRVRLDLHDTPEFDRWKWIDYWQPIEEVVFFKRDVYRNTLCELASNLFEGDDMLMPSRYFIRS